MVWRAVADDELLDVAIAMAGRAASSPRELAMRVKESIKDMASVDNHPDAVARELDPQVWSINQPAFAERLAALQTKIASAPSGATEAVNTPRR